MWNSGQDWKAVARFPSMAHANVKTRSPSSQSLWTLQTKDLNPQTKLLKSKSPRGQVASRIHHRHLWKSQIWALQLLKAVVTLASTTDGYYMHPLGSSLLTLETLLSNPFFCVCAYVSKQLILLDYSPSEILRTFSFTSRPCSLPSFPLLTNPWFSLIQFCFSGITCLF